MSTTVLRVALVDDHALVRAGQARLLALEPDICVVAEHADADAAFDALRAAPQAVDVLVLDLSLPGRSGLDLLRRVTMHWPRLAVLVCSMHDSLPVLAQAMAAGARGFVTKASDPGVLIEAIRAVARGEQALSPDLQPLRGHLAAAAPHEGLSPREFEVLLRLARGESVDLIASRLHLSTKRVANLQSSLRAKLSLSNAVELVHYARRNGLITE